MKNKNTSLMLTEALAISVHAEKVIDADFAQLPGRPDRIYTLGRGSSDHAALVLHHLFCMAGIPSTGLALSLADEVADTANSLYLFISQSGASPDMCDAARHIRQKGCTVMSLVNHDNSRLSKEANFSLSQYAGNELAVAATKSVVCSILAGAKLAQHWGALSLNMRHFPEQVKRVQALPIQALVDVFANTSPIMIIGRGSGYGIACEIALKLQELLGRAAMAYSSSEVLHGPAGMIATDYPVLALAVGSEKADVLDCVEKLQAMGAQCHVLQAPLREDALAATLLMCQLYIALEVACHEMGRSPDEPSNLNKVTLT